MAVCAFFAAGFVRAAQQSRPDALWLDVPFIHQTKDGCGSAALSMLMEFWQSKNASIPAGRADAAHIQSALYSPEAHGIYASAMQKYLEESGFRVFAFRGTWSDLQEHISKGRPLLAAIRPNAHAAYHYVVVSGVDPGGAVFLNDPSRGKLLRVPRDEFEKQWQYADCWLLLAVPKPPA
jgi:predicted double-glycine peptidase